MVDMLKGERYMYADAMLSNLKRQGVQEDKLVVYYDIACQYVKHVNVSSLAYERKMII